MANKRLAILIHGKKTYVRGVGYVTIWAEMPKPLIMINGTEHKETKYWVSQVPEYENLPKLCYYFYESGR